jgi:Ca2+-binding EF-hand superfamily protein
MEIMMQPFTKITASFLVLGLLSAPVFAQEGPPPPSEEMAMNDHGGLGDHRGKHGHHGRKHGRMMQLIDANADGVINEDEAAALADGLFMRLDDNRDGSLSEAEFISGPKHRRGWFNWNSDEAAAVEKVRKDKFEALDTDKNSTVSKVEFFAEAKARLAAADTDKDGKVTPWEFRAAN